MKILSKLDNTGMIEETADKRYVTDAEKITWNGKADKTYVDDGLELKADKAYVSDRVTFAEEYLDYLDSFKADNSYVDSELAAKVDNSRVLTDVPANAKFTDTNTTYSEISTAEIDAGTASTGRTITGRRVKYILDKISSMISVAIGALTKSSVGLGNVDNTSDASKPISTATQTALNGKVNNSQVLTNVPSGAKFTDTITTINGKTGAIAKADIVALGIPAQDTVVDISGKADKTYVDNKVKTDVPVGAKFTDTVYSHPATHSADMITDGTTNKVYTSAEKTKLSGIATNANNYSHPTGDGSKHVPANGTTNNGKVLKAGATAGTYTWSNDNDTITTINGKTGAITKADITALGIPAQDTNTTYSEITTAEIDTGTASTLRTITARRLKYLLDKIVALFPTKTSELTNDSGFITRWPTWSEVTSKPSTFTPAEHNQAWDTITSKPVTATRWPIWSEVTSKPTTATRWPTWSEVTGKPSTFAPSSHTHTWAQVTSKPAQATRWPEWSEVTDKPHVIQESGSNSNGKYIKFTDGTMICYKESHLVTWVFSQALSGAWTFPASFGSASVTVLPSFDAIEDGRRGKLNIFTRNTTTTTVDVLVASDESVFPTGTTKYCKLMAIGRW